MHKKDSFVKKGCHDSQFPNFFLQGQILEPASIYNYLLNSLSPTDTFKVIEGRQEDAEEFLTFLLNGLNDEILALFKSVDKGQGQAQAEASDIDPDEEDEWQEVGPKNKSVVTRRYYSFFILLSISFLLKFKQFSTKKQEVYLLIFL